MDPERPAGRVLLVEDDAHIREALQVFLEEAGFEVDAVGDGVEAIPRVEEAQPDVVVIDLVLPVVNGLDTARALRADPRSADLPLIAVTASWLGSKPDWLLELGFNGALRKPFPPEALIAELRRVLGPERSRDALTLLPSR